MKGFFRAATAVAIISQLLSITNATVFHSNDQAANDVNPTHVFREESRGLSSANNFIRGERSASTDFHDVTFAVKLANLEEMERIFLDISNPSSPNFGKHMTKDEVDDLTANPTALQFVLDHLKSAGATILPDQSLGPYNIKARAPVALWESMFDTEFFAYSHTSGHAIGNVVRAEKYSVPAALDEHVSSVFNTIQTPHVRSHKLPLADHMNTPAATEESLKLASLLLNDLTTPQLLNNAYEITDNSGHPKATQAIFSMYDQMYSPDDITTFQEYVTVPLQKVNKTIGVGPTTVAMCAADNDKCAEGNADLSYIMALSNSPTYYYGTSSYSLAEWIQADVVQSSDPPKVISISYGADEIYVSAAEYDSFQTSAISLGLRGVTIVVSSGDDGVHSYDARGNTAKCGYMPGFPASCPYVTSVGATQGIESRTKEVVSSVDIKGDCTSGGGFSTIFTQPAWQKDAVDAYFKIVDGTAVAPLAGYARNGRGFPDVSMAGSRFIAVVGGKFIGIGGSSLATPVFGGVISLINSARYRAGKTSIGFLNQILYANAPKFANDITVGRNKCTGVVTCCNEGFEATAGWDPASGLGSVNYPKLKEFMVAL